MKYHNLSVNHGGIFECLDLSIPHYRFYVKQRKLTFDFIKVNLLRYFFQPLLIMACRFKQIIMQTIDSLLPLS